MVLSWKEINSWMQATQRELTPWEVNMLMSMSKAYVSEMHSATDKYRPAPYVEKAVTVEAKIKEEENLMNFFEMLSEK